MKYLAKGRNHRRIGNLITPSISSAAIGAPAGEIWVVADAGDFYNDFRHNFKLRYHLAIVPLR
jgi:hypothetical protein